MLASQLEARPELGQLLASSATALEDFYATFGFREPACFRIGPLWNGLTEKLEHQLWGVPLVIDDQIKDNMIYLVGAQPS